MYSWNLIRAICLALLLLPLAHVGILRYSAAQSVADPSPTTWQNEIDAYIELDNRSQLPVHPVVLVGGREVRHWQDLQDILTPKPVLIRGVGNATVEDITYYSERLINFYQPHTLVILPSYSDFAGRDDKSAFELLKSLQALAERVTSLQVTEYIYVLSPIKTPSHPGLDSTIDEALGLLEAWAKQDQRIRILDTNDLLDDLNRQPNRRYFQRDGLGLNDAGYLRLSIMLRAQLEEDDPEFFGVGP